MCASRAWHTIHSRQPWQIASSTGLPDRGCTLCHLARCFDQACTHCQPCPSATPPTRLCPYSNVAEFNRGDLFVIRYRAVQPLLAEGAVELL